jgi:glycosyltransferase involved in cell wall biosynthesis
MGILEAYPPVPIGLRSRRYPRLAVVGITHSQTCLVLRGRISALREAGFSVVLISSPGIFLDQLALEEGAEQWAIPMHRGISPFSDVVALVRLIRAIRSLRPDIAEFSTPKAGLLGSLAAFLCRVPTRLYMLRGLRLETATGLRRALLLFAERVAAACSHLVVCNSESLRRQARNLGIAPDRKLRLIGNGSSNGVDIVRFSSGPDTLRPALGIPRGAPVVGFVGRLTRDKGVPVLIEAFCSILREMPDAWLLLVGWYDHSEDALTPEERARIDRHPRIVRTGFVSDTAPYYRSMDVMVLPTWREGFPNVALESAASGIPVITTLATGARDAVVAGRTGLLIPTGNPRALASAVLRLLSDPELRREMGSAARHWVTEHFVESDVLGHTVALYHETLREARQKRVRAPEKHSTAAAD